MHADLDRVLIDRDALSRRVGELAREIGAAFRADRSDPAAPAPEITLVPLLTGSLIFVADLMRQIPAPLRIHALSVSSYPGVATTAQTVSFDDTLDALPDDLSGRRVLVVDDILDSGATLRAVCGKIAERRPAGLNTAVLLRKRRDDLTDDDGRDTRPAVDFAAFDIPDAFVVGYGLDFDGWYRNLPEIGVLRADVIARAQHRAATAAAASAAPGPDGAAAP